MPSPRGSRGSPEPSLGSPAYWMTSRDHHRSLQCVLRRVLIISLIVWPCSAPASVGCWRGHGRPPRPTPPSARWRSSGRCRSRRWPRPLWTAAGGVRPDGLGRTARLRRRTGGDVRLQRRLPGADAAGPPGRAGRGQRPQRARRGDERALARHAPAAHHGRRPAPADRPRRHVVAHLDRQPAGRDPLVPPAPARRDSRPRLQGARRHVHRRRPGHRRRRAAARVRGRRRAGHRAGQGVRRREAGQR